MTLSTVDTLKGSEMCILIFLATRGSPIWQAAFLADEKRPNVSSSRARNLNIIVSDQEMCTELPSVKVIYGCCAGGDNGPKVMTVVANRDRGPDDFPYLLRIMDTKHAATQTAAEVAQQHDVFRDRLYFAFSTLYTEAEHSVDERLRWARRHSEWQCMRRRSWLRCALRISVDDIISE